MERQKSLETSGRSLVLEGNEHTLVFIASHNYWDREVSYGYGNAYIRNAKYKELSGVCLILNSDGTQVEVEMTGGEYETGRRSSAVTSLRKYLHIQPSKSKTIPIS